VSHLERLRAELGIDPEEAKDRRERLGPVRAELVRVHDQDLLVVEMREVLLELQPVATDREESGPVSGSVECVLERADLGMVEEAEEIVGDDPVDRVADEIDEARVRDQRVDPPRDVGDIRVARVRDRRFAADRRARVELALVPLPAAAALLRNEEIRLLLPRHRDLGMPVEVLVQAGRAALGGADHEEVREHSASVPRDRG